LSVETLLYNGNVRLKFVDSTHRYYVNIKDEQGEWGKTIFPTGVTSTLHEVYGSGSLLEWYSSMASNDIVIKIAGKENEEWLKTAFLALYSGKPYTLQGPGVHCFFDPQQLIDLYKLGKDAPNRRSSFGKDVGSQTHEAVDRFHKTGKAFIDLTGIEENDKAAQKSLDMYIKWFEASDLEVVASEVMVYSQKHNYSGTLDRIYKRPDGGLVMGDFKTSNISRQSPLGIRNSYWSQLGAYMVAHREEHNSTFVDAVIVNSPKKGTIKIGYASDMGLTPLELEDIWITDMTAFRNHKKVDKVLSTLKSRTL
jgi:hypothetical protein